MDILRDPMWQFGGVFFSLMISFVALVISIRIYQKQRRLKEITYEVIANTSSQSAPNASTGQHSLILKLWNSGNVPILPTDYVSPIVFEFGMGTQVLDTSVVETTPGIPKNTVPVKIRKSGVELEPFLLNSKDAITFKVLLDHFSGQIEPYSRIVGLREIRSRTKHLHKK